MVVFGLMTFGAEAIKWDEDLFFHRTGIAFRYWKSGVGRNKL